MEIFVGTLVFIIVFGSSILAVHFIERNVFLSFAVFALGLCAMCMLSRLTDGAEVIIIYPDNSLRRETWKKTFIDSRGNPNPVENRGEYVFFDCLGEDDLPDVDISIFEEYFTTHTDMIGKPVTNPAPVRNISLHPYQLQRIPWVHRAFTTIPSHLTTSDCSDQITLTCLDFTSIIGAEYSPIYRRLDYDPPVTYY